MDVVMLKCKTCKTKFLTILKLGKVKCPQCGAIDEITNIKIGEGHNGEGST